MGDPPSAPSPKCLRSPARLRRENERLQKRLEQAEFIIDFQKKVAQMFGKTLETPDLDDPS